MKMERNQNLVDGQFQYIHVTSICIHIGDDDDDDKDDKNNLNGRKANIFLNGTIT
jgi:hypothetical protein